MTKKIILSTIFLGVCFVTVFGARPFAVDDAGIVPQNSYEIESGIIYKKSYMNVGFECKHGITNRLDIGTNFGYLAIKTTESHISPIGLSFKYGLIQEVISMSVGTAFGSPFWNINFIFSKFFNKHFSFHTNIGIEAESFSNSALLTYGILFNFHIAKITMGMEVLGTNEHIIGDWQIGSRFEITNWFAYDAGIKGCFSKDINIGVTTGLWFGF